MLKIKKKILFSIIIPTKINNKTFSYFKNCINSLVNQTLKYSYFEVIIIDNGSKKKIDTFLNQTNKKLDNIKLISFKKEIGPGIARNHGIKISKGEFLVFLDSDDILPNYCLEEYYKIISKQNIDLITSNWSYINSNKPRRKDFKYLNKGRLNLIKKFISMNFDGSVIFTIVKKKVFIDNKIIFPKGYHEDIFIIFKKFFFSKSVKVLDKIMYLKRNNRYSIMNSFDEKRIIGYLNSWKLIKKFLIKKFGKTHFSKNFETYFVKGIYGIVAIMILENKRLNRLKKKQFDINMKIASATKKFFNQDIRRNKLRNRTFYDKIAKGLIENYILFNQNIGNKI